MKPSVDQNAATAPKTEVDIPTDKLFFDEADPRVQESLAYFETKIADLKAQAESLTADALALIDQAFGLGCQIAGEPKAKEMPTDDIPEIWLKEPAPDRMRELWREESLLRTRVDNLKCVVGFWKAMVEDYLAPDVDIEEDED